MPRPPLYFTLVRLADGDLASPTVIRKPTEFFAQLRSYGFTEHSGAASPKLAEMQTGAFLDTVAGVFSVSRDRPFTYIIPEGMPRAEWLAAMEEKAHDPRFFLRERDGEFSYCTIIPRLK
ncbi:hypothetical protein G6L26_008585 [Agrobacterium radiobacter]|uniref:Uncharacterized protein n=1 Tax=Agrobacterium tumefaciens str. B6 TaxID=1183423 RepID=A0A822UWB5_AGRTU|nr:hypothetical protein [Agrobacterium tumefaciens]KWT87906.1 hypothetical protein ASB65_19600 [Agrobacterium tumefaciens str. B6]MQB28390.1 hypothetical protein [Agrobacterium tumefaciens]NTA05241.1 hypothetical protein [Agrobacterium tumefaciens]NTA91836.1 hypothetical protein [Agrobacterium tumefaciens]NTB12986.1 hypothetical protein [Agrobacterium tumefaciens]